MTSQSCASSFRQYRIRSTRSSQTACAFPARFTIFSVARNQAAESRRKRAATRSTSMPRNARTQHKSSAVNDTVVKQWINYGSAAQSLSGVKAESPARQRMAASTLAGATRSYASQGVHVWHTPPSYWRALDLAAAARGAGRVVALSEACCVADNPPVGICNSLGGCSSQYGSRQLSESFPSYSLRSLPRIARGLSRGAAVMPSSGVGSITGPHAASDGE